jgi:hypothetical protein
VPVPLPVTRFLDLAVVPTRDEVACTTAPSDDTQAYIDHSLSVLLVTPPASPEKEGDSLLRFRPILDLIVRTKLQKREGPPDTARPINLVPFDVGQLRLRTRTPLLLPLDLTMPCHAACLRLPLG